jgi:hypothetical protein
LSILLTIAGVTYNYPEQGQDPQWGDEAADWAQAVSNVLNTLIAPGDILATTATINDNVSVVTDINGLNFDPTLVRSTNVTYNIYRVSIDTPSGNSEDGTLFINYDNNAAPGSKWTLSQRTNGNSGVAFSILDNGQVQYISTEIDTGSGGYSGTINFSARSLAP